MAVLNLRGVPDELAKRLKSEAALVGISLREYCVGILGCAMAVADKKWPWDGYGVSGAGSGVSKKIAEVSAGAVAQDAGVAPEEALPRGGKTAWRKEFVKGMEDVQKVMRDAEKELRNTSNSGAIVIPAKKPLLIHEGWNFPQWSPEQMKKIAAEEPGGLMACSPELLAEMKEAAKIDGGAATTLHLAGVELDREILVRWGLVENKSEDQDGATDDFAGRAKKRKGGGVVGGNSSPDADGAHVVENGAVGVGEPKVNMDALRNICAGNIPLNPIPEQIAKMNKAAAEIYAALPSNRHEVDLCGFKSYNDVDGENYICGKEKHGPKVRHGEWIKI